MLEPNVRCGQTHETSGALVVYRGVKIGSVYRIAEQGNVTSTGNDLDLAVSVDRGGSDTWSEAACYALGASVGAPPDEFNPNGQNWGLPPLRPDRLRAGRYAPFIETLRENMQDAGALRIDHVMGLMRLFWVPAGGGPGTYVHYALEEMLAIVALERVVRGRGAAPCSPTRSCRRGSA